MLPGDRSESPPGRLRPPGFGLLLAEMRGIFEFNTSLLLSPLLMRAPRGDGHPVLTLPGFLASDLSMAPMRRYLRELGYDAYAWKIGRNIGGVSRMRAALRDRLAEIHADTGRKVSIVGWSLGGVYARDLALHAPDQVRCVVTLGSPFANDVRATNATRLYEVLSGEVVGEDSELRKAIAGDLPVPATSIYSRADGANLPPACLRYRREYRGAPRQPFRARRQRGRSVGGRRPSGASRRPIQSI
jgi:pimeloyl-ACP methyl ester carboxylesterase